MRPSRSGRQALATFGAAVGEHLAAADRRHPGAKPVPALADQLRGLIGALHDSSPLEPESGNAGRGRARVAGARRSRRLIRAGAIPVNHVDRGCSRACAASQKGHPASELLLPRYLKPLIIGLALAGLAFAAWRCGLGAALSWAELARHQARLVALVAAHPVLAPLIYAALYTVWVALSIPEAALVTVAGGLLFGTILGGAMAVLGATAGAVILFLVARSAFADAMRRRAGAFLDRIRPKLHRDGFSYLLALRLVPAPFWLINLAAALSGMRLLPYTAATLIGIIPATFVLAWIGAGVADVLTAGRSPDLGILFSVRVLGPLVALAALALLPVAWRTVRRR